MNEEKPVQPTRRWGLIAASSCLGVFILGFILGLLFDAHDRPNYITLELDPQSDQIKVSPRQGDVVNWKERGSDADVKIHYLTDSPCTEPDGSSICHVKANSGQYTYLCRDPQGHPITCDPGNDPQPNNDVYIKSTTFGSVKVALGEDPGAGLANPKGGPSTATPASATSHIPAVQAGVSCDTADPHPPIVRSSTDSTTTPITMSASVGQKIQWLAGQRDFTVTNFLQIPASGPPVPITVCTDATPIGSLINDTSVCKVISNLVPIGSSINIQYTVSTPGPNSPCPTTTGTAYLTVTNP
jgi:hypothetical protein